MLQKIINKGMTMKKNSNQKGFSLVELLVVVAIIGILAAVGVVTYNGYIANARVSAAKATHNTIVAYATAEAAKCSIDQGASFTDDACVGLTDSNALRDSLIAYVNANFDNAYDSGDAAVSAIGTLTCNAEAAGDIGIVSGDAVSITVETCVDDTEKLVSNTIGIY